MAFHPRDIGTLLIGYPEGAVVYSFKQNQVLKTFHYEVPQGAPGADADPLTVNQVRQPRLTHALWHPTGTFILTGHEDASLVFWDPRDGRILEARTVQDSGIHLPGGGQGPRGGPAGTVSVKGPYVRIAWCCKENPEDTGLLIAGASPSTDQTRGLTFIDLGVTPNYQTSSWDVLIRHFQNPKRIQILPTPPNAEVVDFCLIPRTSPYYAGAHDPIAVITLLSSGEVVTTSFPSGHPITPTNLLHVSLSFVHPFATKVALACVDRTRWLGMREVRQQGPNFLIGGAEGTRPLKRFENRNVVQVAHADGTIRVWDAGHGDEIENSVVLQVDLARAVGRWDNVEVTQVSLSGAAAELSVGLRSGEVVVFRLGRNQNAGRPPRPESGNEGAGRMTDISTRADPGLREGLLPVTMTNDQQGPVTALTQSDVGFVAVGYESGGITIIDMRGPAIIFSVLLGDLAATVKKRTSMRTGPKQPPSQSTSEWATVLEFGVMTLEGEGKHMNPCGVPDPSLWFNPTEAIDRLLVQIIPPLPCLLAPRAGVWRRSRSCRRRMGDTRPSWRA